MLWQDNAHHNAKHQVCNTCSQRLKWVKYATVQGKYTNLLFCNVYWTPCPLPMELADIEHLDLDPAQNVKAKKDEDEAEVKLSQQGASNARAKRVEKAFLTIKAERRQQLIGSTGQSYLEHLEHIFIYLPLHFSSINLSLVTPCPMSCPLSYLSFSHIFISYLISISKVAIH